MDKFLKWLTMDMPTREIIVGGKRYIERHFGGKWRNITLYLHRYLSCDGDRSVHDHPWGWSVGIVLCGGYIEERVIGLCPKRGWISRHRKIRPFIPNFIWANTFHRIDSVKPNTWTLFLHGKKLKGWGFLTELTYPHHTMRGTLYEHHSLFHRDDGNPVSGKDWMKTADPAWHVRHMNGESAT